ncbi:MAG: carbohydrate ABC transporter permease [Clostridia bacterium]|nr:carbohydrate ABC transporter permease [Clostridia bacterium]
MLLFVFPFYWMFITAFKTYNESIQTPPTLWPMTFTLHAFETIASKELSITQYAINSVVTTGSVIILQLVTMVPAAYAFAKRDFPGRGFLFILILIAFMIPGQVTYIPVYLMMADWKMISSLWPQILPFACNSFGIFMLRQAFKQIPDELLESARLDKANELQIMTRLLLPMCTSSMVTIALFSFVSHWNAYFWPLVMTNSDKFRPLTMYIEKVKDAEYGLIWPSIMAANTILVVPVLIVYIFASKRIIKAFAYSGIK